MSFLSEPGAAGLVDATCGTSGFGVSLAWRTPMLLHPEINKTSRPALNKRMRAFPCKRLQGRRTTPLMTTSISWAAFIERLCLRGEGVLGRAQRLWGYWPLSATEYLADSPLRSQSYCQLWELMLTP
jgi:hypothetical protein